MVGSLVVALFYLKAAISPDGKRADSSETEFQGADRYCQSCAFFLFHRNLLTINVSNLYFFLLSPSFHFTHGSLQHDESIMQVPPPLILLLCFSRFSSPSAPNTYPYLKRAWAHLLLSIFPIIHYFDCYHPQLCASIDCDQSWHIYHGI